MAAGDFGLTPTWVHPEEPEFNVVVTQSDNLKKDRQTISTNAVNKYRMIFTGLSDTDYKTLYDHYVARKGSFSSFTWLNTNIPAYLKTLLGITSGTLTIRWVDGTFKSTPRPRSWDAEIVAEQEIT